MQLTKISCCTDHYESCFHVYTSGKSLPGNYYLKIHNSAVEVHCLEQGWIVFQSRGQFGNPSDYFYKGWNDYVNGFGTPGKKYIIDILQIYLLTLYLNVLTIFFFLKSC